MLKSLDSDVSRHFAFSATYSPSFNFGGYSNSGGILNINNILNKDIVSYIFQSSSGLATIPPTFYFQYLNSSSYSALIQDPNQFQSNCINSIFMPTYIIEYEDINDQDGFQYGDDTLLGYVDLSQLKYTADYDYSNFAVDYSSFGTQDIEVYQINLTSTGDYENLIKIVLYFSGAPVDLGDGRIMSSEILRFDIFIQGYYDSYSNKQSSNECYINNNGNGGGGGGGGNRGNEDGPIKVGCISTGPSNNLQSRLAVTSFFSILGYDISMDIDANKININGFPLPAKFSWLPNAKINKDNNIGVANVYTDSSSLNEVSSIFGSDFIPVAITGNVSSKFLIQSFDVKRPDIILWTSYLGIPSKYETNNSNNLNLTFSNNLIISLILFKLLF
ncbi:hypothetical protein ACTA71_000543 [Dictyostelium dimigraforme]